MPVGRGARERTRVKYDDGLTEEQWLEAVDNDEDSIEAAIARKEAKIARRGKKRLSGMEDSPVPSRESSEEPVPKKRGRKPKAEKRKADEASLDGDPVPRKRGRPGATAKETLRPEERVTLQKIVNAVYEALNDLEEESNDENIQNRGIIEIGRAHV